MKTVFAFILASTLGAFAHAGPERAVNCNVQNLRDAQACMQAVAEAYTEYEEPNEGFATDRTDKLLTAMKLITERPAILKQIAQADFAGMLLEHGDEHHIYYFTIKKGKSSPVEIYDLNTVDYEYMLTKPYSAEALDPNTWILGISEARDSHAYEETAERLAELK